MNLQYFLQTINEFCNVVYAAGPTDLLKKVRAQSPEVAYIRRELPSVEMDRLLADLRRTSPHLIVIYLHPDYEMPGTVCCSTFDVEVMPA